MKYSTGRGTRVKHSTAMEWDEYERRKRRGRSRLRHSTGRNAALLHSSGTITDNQGEEELEAQRAAEAEQRAAGNAAPGRKLRKPPHFKGMKAEY
ncbi:MAG: hypothetical protein KAX19_10135 [Candidatus Brocadiae bacterium]|nr:hypothetical protein [Candidatus Brocadiia bacterium]